VPNSDFYTPFKKKKQMQPTTAGNAWAPEMDKHSIEAMVSMLIVSHPIPPLPVVCGQGGGRDYAEAVASSHDILANGMRWNLTHSGQTLDAVAGQRIQSSKEQILRQMYTTVSRAWNNHLNDAVRFPEPSTVEHCYRQFCLACRQYQALYPGSADLRIAGMSSVCRDTCVHTQALSHLRARETCIDDEGNQFLRGLVDRDCYYSIIKGYAVHLWAYSTPTEGVV